MIGLGVMGQNLSLNIEEHGYPIALWDREPAVTDRMIAANPGKKLVGTRTLEEFARSLERPRRMLMLIKAGPPVDSVIESVRPYLESGDLVIDCGNSLFTDTQRREAALKAQGF